MASLGAWIWGSSQLDDAIDKATSELLPAGTEDIALNLEISDQIRSKSVPAKDAMRSLKRRLDHKNPNVQLSALTLIDLCVKNGGDHFLVEISSKEFMDNLVSILKYPGLNHQVKQKLLHLIQNWSASFEEKSALSYVPQVYTTLKKEGFNFPPPDAVATSSAMIDTKTAPEWIDSEVCMRCRTPFSFTNRKHHCRNCGQVFDQICSAKVLPLPHFGITQEVRVCEPCHVKLTRTRNKSGDSGKTHRHSSSVHGSRHRSVRELADAELERAIQLSLEEAGVTGVLSRSGYVPSHPPPTSEPPLVDRYTQSSSAADEEDDPDLKAAIEASLREANAPKPSAPMSIETPRIETHNSSMLGISQSYPLHTTRPQGQGLTLPNYDLDPLETDAIMTFSQTVEQVKAQDTRDITRYPALNQLYDQANGLRPKLVMSLDDTGKREQLLTEMHDKLSQAVRIYDNILTEQVAHPAWRSTQPVRAATTHPTQYNQQNQLSPQHGTASQPQQLSQPSAQYQYQPPTSPSAQPAWYYQPQQHLPSQTPPSMSSSTVISHPQRPLAQTYDYSPPVVAPSQSPAPSSSQPPLPPQHSRPMQTSVQPSIQTVQYDHSVPPDAANRNISRTVSVVHPRPPQQPPQRMYSTPPAPLPHFPVAPTSPPLFLPSVPTAVEQPGRPEALLIDL